jgi:hypothetical protein
MGLYFKGQMLGIGLIAAAVGVSEVDKTMNYIQVEAVVTKADVDCFIKAGNESVVEKKNNSLAYMDCEMAPYAAKEYGFKETDISKRTKLAFSYVSPVDGSKQKGTHTQEHAEYKVGQKIKIYAHKEEPGKNRW